MSLIPEGTYLARVNSSALGFTKGGDPQLAIGFDIELTDGGTASRTWYGYFTEKSEPTTNKALENLGFNTVERLITELSPEEPTRTPIAGVVCKVVVQHEIHNVTGETVDKIRWVNSKDGPAGGLAMKERMTPAQAQEFAARFRARVSGGRTASPAPSAPKPAGVDFGDIPFVWFLPFLLLLA